MRLPCQKFLVLVRVELSTFELSTFESWTVDFWHAQKACRCSWSPSMARLAPPPHRLRAHVCFRLRAFPTFVCTDPEPRPSSALVSRKALRGGFSKVNLHKVYQLLAIFPHKNEPMAPRTNLGYPHEGPSVALVYLVIHDSGMVSLEHLLPLRCPSPIRWANQPGVDHCSWGRVNQVVTLVSAPFFINVYVFIHICVYI